MKFHHIRTALVGGIAVLLSGNAAPSGKLCPAASAVLPQLACVESANGVVLAGDTARAQRLLELAESGVVRFKEYFGRQALRYAVAEGPDVLVPPESVGALRKAGFPVVLPWISPKVYRQQVEQSIRRGLTARMAGRPQEEIDAAVLKAVEQQTNPERFARTELATVSHELGHYWFWQGYWPKSTLSEDKHYGGPSPDWLDEMSAVLMEAPVSFNDRVKQFGQRYATYRVDPQKADENTRLTVDLVNFLSETHPAHEQTKLLSQQVGGEPKNGSFKAMVFSGEEARKIIEGGARFYLQSAVASQYLIDRTGNRQIFGRIAEAFARGETMAQWLANKEPKGKLPRDLKALQADWMAWLATRFPAEATTKPAA